MQHTANVQVPEYGSLMKRPLDGITVIDLGQIYNGPYATFLMAKAGAEVIKIEPPGGEKMRRRGSVGGAMLPFAMLNSNKEFITLNLKSPEGLELLHRMVARPTSCWRILRPARWTGWGQATRR